MVEQIRISPEEVRGYGNICEGHTLEDFIVSNSGLAKEKENVHGALTSVYKLVYSVYGLMFDFDKGNKQLYLQMAEADTLSFGFDTVNKQLYLVDENDTGFSLSFDEDTNELYITDDAPPIVHNYSLALDQSSYTTTGSLSVSATLLDDGVAVSGATVSFTGGVSTVTATTNGSGVATATVNFTSSGTLTASYSNVSDTASVTVSHNYSLAFSSSSYVATGGSAEVSVTLLDDNVAVTGATISFTGGTSTVTGVTNSSGVATATVSVSATSTITATYQNVSDTCTVTVSNVIFTDDCTSNKTSQYSDAVIIGNGGAMSLTFDTTETAYYTSVATTGSDFAGFVIPNTRGEDSIKISCTVKVTSNSAYNQFAIGCADVLSQTTTGTFDVYRIRGDNKADYLHNNWSEVSGSTKTTNVRNNYVTMVFEKDGNEITCSTYDTNDTLLSTYTYTNANTYTNPYFFFLMGITRDTHQYIKLIKAESLE